MNINKNFIIAVFRILMIILTTSTILIQPLIDAVGNEKVVYDFVDLEEEPNSNEGNNEEEVLKEKKLDNQFIGNNLNYFIEKSKKLSYYKECIHSDSNLEIHIPPPDFL